MSSFVWLVTVVVLPSADLTFYRFAKFQPPSLCVAQKKVSTESSMHGLPPIVAGCCALLTIKYCSHKWRDDADSVFLCRSSAIEIGRPRQFLHFCGVRRVCIQSICR